jgi:hypothetical protein
MGQAHLKKLPMTSNKQQGKGNKKSEKGEKVDN